MRTDFDFALIGGGLQNALLALSLRRSRPAASVLLVERGASLGGNHTWCFHAADVPDDLREVVDPLVVRRWAGYDVHFPNLSRRLDQPYAAADSHRLDAVVRSTFAAAPHWTLRTDTTVAEVDAGRITFADGTSATAGRIVDARGPAGDAANGSQPIVPEGAAGYQKFVGLVVELAEPSGLDRPLVMDARLPQTDGFRFMYTLPFDERRLLVEETFFSDDPALDRDAGRRAILDYCKERGWNVTGVEREEVGLLPLPWRQSRPRVEAVARPQAPLVGGYAGGWFHPVTGYSFPVALRLAAALAREPADRWPVVYDELATVHRRRLVGAHWLNWMFFRGCPPADRWRLMERFYRLPDPLVLRFYALQLRWTDWAMILFRRPPWGLSLRRLTARPVKSIGPAVEASACRP
ncbi:MAG: lycopene beta-cyclase CrtY [Planctomycetia bacterium]